jgi:hypothetical protein
MDAALAQLLTEHPSLSLNERGKVHCALTGHDMPAKADAVCQFVAGKAYTHARGWYSADFSKYEPYIVAHKRDAHKLFCRLTRQALNRIPEEVRDSAGGGWQRVGRRGWWGRGGRRSMACIVRARVADLGNFERQSTWPADRAPFRVTAPHREP